MKPIKIVLAGQPNVGKSMLINAISKSNLKVGNFSGVTVEKMEVCFEHHCHLFELVDLPGTYSIEGFSEEEKVAKDYLLNEEYDIILNVVDSTHLQRNILLSLELAKLGKKMVIALNMSDEADKEGIFVDSKQLQLLMAIPCVKVSANTKTGIEELWEAIHDVFENNRVPSKIIYNDSIENEISELSEFLEAKQFQFENLNYREIALLLICEDKKLFKFIHENPIYTELQPIMVNAMNTIYTYYESKNIKEIFQKEHFSIARGIRIETTTYQKTKKHTNLTQRIDDILIHKIFGIPIFLFFMWGLFQLTFTLGAIPMDFIDMVFVSLQDISATLIKNEMLKELIVDGIIAGVGAVVLFLPNILILYLGIALLETTGYMSRVAFLLDGFFHKFGLHGKSFIPLVTGFGCSVPAYMAARTLKNKKDKLITLFIIGFMSCSARLPIYVLFAGAFFASESAGNILFLIYMSGAIFGLLMAKILRVFVFRGEDEPFVMEMPKYRLPTIRLLWFTVSNNAWLYLKKAGTFILAASILIWFASNYPKVDAPSNLTEIQIKKFNLENSYLGQIGQATNFLFEPIGFDWKMTIALETGLAAKEVVVATLGILYNVGDDVNESSDSLISELKKNISFASAISFIVFVMLYLPCLAASMVFTKEAGGYKYLGYLFVFTTSVAWLASFIVYNIIILIV